MNREMRRAWRRDIRRRKRQRKKEMSTVEQTPTDLTWEQVTEHEDLQQLLYTMFEAPAGGEFEQATQRVVDWIADHVVGCAAELQAATRLDQAAYCENISAPGRDGYCSEHQEPDEPDWPEDDPEPPHREIRGLE